MRSSQFAVAAATVPCQPTHLIVPRFGLEKKCCRRLCAARDSARAMQMLLGQYAAVVAARRQDDAELLGLAVVGIGADAHLEACLLAGARLLDDGVASADVAAMFGQ